jgi:ATP-dependent Clp protease ATP-binding subunit ClpB
VRLERLREELADLNEQATGMLAHWEREKELIDSIRQTKEAIEQARMEGERAEREGDLQRVAEIRYGTLVELERQLADGNQALASLQSDRKMLNEEVSEEDVADVVAQWTGIPVARLLEGEMQKLVRLEEHLHERVVGQDKAVTAVANAIRRSRAGMQDPNRPIGSFLFLGPTGVGKTELARALADYLFDDDRAIVRIDMSEYQERHTVSRLVGAPPGYVGYEEGGQLTEAVRRRPYSVVLLDEMEKAHGDVFNILLQLLDDGRLTDGHGRTVDFRNAIVIMTSNLGSAVFQDPSMTPEQREEAVLEEVRTYFRPEFINRIDEIVVFEPLGQAQIREIVEIQLRGLRARLADRNIELEVTDAALDHLAAVGYDPSFGARPLRRAIQRELQDPLALELLSGGIADGHTVAVDAVDGRLTIRSG